MPDRHLVPPDVRTLESKQLTGTHPHVSREEDHRPEERKMFGGLCFTLNGNMVCGIVGNDLMLRLGSDLADEALAKPHVRPMDFTGRPMTGMVYVAPAGLRGRSLRPWVAKAADHVRRLPPKPARR